jgi:hypothetical protein
LILKVSEIKTLGIILDADTDILRRWESLRDQFRSLSYIMPDDLPITGLVVDPADAVKIGIWLMPNNQTNGMLEDFIRFLIPPDDNLLPIASSILLDLESKGLNRYNNPLHKPKALIHTWLSWQEDPGTPMGLAITKRYLTTEEENCSHFIQWLRDLFS